jgi:hypothetical protein
MPLGSAAYENTSNDKGERYIWLEPNMLGRLRSLRAPDETFSEVILRLAGSGEPR